MEQQQIKQIIEAALLAASQPLSIKQLAELFVEGDEVDSEALQRAIESLVEDCQQRGVELKEVASGYRYQVRQEVQTWVSRLWTERPPKYSRALLETLSLIAYRQPITRGEIEQIRGVAVSTHIIKTLEEREWVRVVGHRDVPGRPALFGTTRGFLDYFSLRSLDELPPLTELAELPDLEPELPLEPIAQARQAELADASASDSPASSATTADSDTPPAANDEAADATDMADQADAAPDQPATAAPPADPETSEQDPAAESDDGDAEEPSAPTDEQHTIPPSSADVSALDSAETVLESAPSPVDNDPPSSATEETSAEPHVEVKPV